MPIGRKGAPGEIREIQGLSFFNYFFPQTRILKQPVHGISRTMAQNTRRDVRKCLFGVHTMADNILGFKFPKKQSKMAFYKHVRASANGLKTNDVIKDRRHGFATLPLAVVAERRIVFIASGESLRLCIFKWLSIIFGTEIQFWQVYRPTAFVDNLLYRVLHKMISCAVWLEGFKKMETLIRRRRTLEEPID